jgi:hypothetical protein
MDALQAIRENLTFAREAFVGTIADVTPAMAAWDPKGKANNIASLYAHTIHGEDMVIQGMLQGKPQLWERDGWDKKLNIPFNGMMTEANRLMRVDLAAMKPYAEAVAKATNAYLASLKPADLDRKITVGPPLGDQTVGWVIQMFVASNFYMHAGEISALKGIQGHKGYPF